MITNLYSNSPYLRVDQPAVTYISPGPMSGQVRFNTNTSRMEISDGQTWQPVGGLASISVSAEFNQIMDWARDEMQKSARIKQLAEESTAVADAYAAYEEAAHKLQVIMALAEKETV